ncbi:GNAT family N-acetyltransferase [Amycolatopsis rubida]|uniref:GNAT family N-acetyltransferase n=1 Tax=Amycolatopsis rubida TaxID=112413 RepID=A0ABX0C0S2_9PSEU|nr:MULTISPECIES: GNAT family N-acetyltransferase [Amycolatopsis]MYW95934.1 GNAT family N-acetyltransferase [Amycolatopsis rubida]NEC60924.1 GNAT family N-acetyltransferase [Amycolatopsis rubida]OAP25170.1 Acetyltransferase (GNAT) family protein [Amycolatopsis sp. M39]
MFKIDRAAAADAAALTDLMHASSAYQGRYASILEGYAVTPDYLRQHQVLVARGPSGPAGFAALTDAELDSLFVADEAQGTGLGTRLVRQILGVARENGLSEVRVVSHPPAAKFSERMGARRIGIVPARPPKISWSRPELVFSLPETDSALARATTAGQGDRRRIRS